ncbi:MucR family transcriptional regulator [Blastococcus sp. SYSU D00820]
MLHPVGPLPAAVYWRRRLLVLTLLVAVLGGGGWLTFSLVTGGNGGSAAAAEPTSSSAGAAGTPALERVVPSLASVQTPTPPPTTPPAPAPVVETPAPAPGPVPGGPCTDDMLRVEVRTPGSGPAGSKPTFELAVANVSAVPCVRALDKQLQELVLLDGAGNRIWGSNDCYPEVSADLRTLAPGEVVAFPVVWAGLTSEPSCSAARTTVGPGQYVLRGRLDTATSGDAPYAVV